MGKPAPARLLIVLSVLLAAATAAVYWQSLDCGFVKYDDEIHVYDNTRVRQGLTANNIAWALTTTKENLWMPLSWISWMADYQVGELDPAVYHRTNMLLHVINVVLLLLVFARMTGSVWRSVALAAVFGLHPLRVESVAWISERKDVLSTLFFLLSVLAYARYAGASTSTEETRSPERSFLSGPAVNYIGALIFFALSLMAKPMMVTMPLILLILDYWPLRRPAQTLHKLLWDKLPFVVMAGAVSAATQLAQTGGKATPGFPMYRLGVRMADTIVAYAAYLWKWVWPERLAVVYPHPGPHLPAWQVFGSAALLLGITVIACRLRRSRPYLLAGWLWYVIVLLPVSGIVPLSRIMMADRYTYVSLIGISFAAVWGAAELVERIRSNTTRSAVAVTMAAGLAVVLVWWAALTVAQVRTWRNTVTLFSHAVAVTERNSLALLKLGQGLYDQGETERAMSAMREAIAANPRYAAAYNTLATTLMDQNRTDEAIPLLYRAIRIWPDNGAAYANLGAILAGKGDIDGAVRYFRKAWRIGPRNEGLRMNLERAIQMQGGEE